MKVLVVEDDIYSSKYLSVVLEKEGIESQFAYDGIEGLKKFEEFKPDLVLSDILMPKMDGLQMLANIQKKKTEAIFVIITAFGTEEYAIKALELGAKNYLKKPIRNSDILKVIRKYNSIIENRKFQQKKIGKVIKLSFTMLFENNINQIPQIIDSILKDIKSYIAESEIVSIELGLIELITNAMEHGNMNISYTEKQEALNNNSLMKLYTDRMSQSKYAKRKVEIKFVKDSNFFEWTIIDEGNGFNWNIVPDPTDSDKLLELSGRGIFITKFLFDELEYIGVGNTVRVRKYNN